MAELGAHLISNNLEKPSIFELVAANSLDSTFYPALKRIANYLATTAPDKLSFLVKYYDELFLLLNGAVQTYYLRHFGSSLSESFYGLKRYSLETNKFNRKEFMLSWLMLIVIPYLSRKLEARMNKLKDQLQDDYHQQEKYQLLIVYTYRTLKGCYELSKVVKYISYLAGLSSTHSVQLKLFGMGLKHADIEEESFKWSDVFSGKINLSSVLSTLTFRGLELAGFFLQFAQWWNSEASQKAITNLPTPEAPSKETNASKYLSICSICFQSFMIPTVLSISGYVFCFKCITKHLNKNQYCPVTNYPATIDDLVRIYDN
ncbi:unnamed protein product [Diamesa serratosioi]